MVITGIIIIMMTTHMFHHRIPLSCVICAETIIGNVCALEVDKNEAKRYSFHERIKINKVVAASPYLHSGKIISQKIYRREAPSN